jgi:flagellar basal-body rod modification protein FlgD
MISTSQLSSNEVRDEFLQLLVAQLRHQDPLDPVKQEDFLSQLAQFSTLEGVEKLNVSFESLLQLQTLTGGAELIGRTVAYTDEGQDFIETVESVHASGRELFVVFPDREVPINQVTSVIA